MELHYFTAFAKKARQARVGRCVLQVEAVAIMARTCCEAESSLNYQSIHQARPSSPNEAPPPGVANIGRHRDRSKCARWVLTSADGLAPHVTIV